MKQPIMVIGAGASGFFAAIHNKEAYPDREVILVEKSREVLSKVKVSGGGRCNVTHACFDVKALCTHYPRGGKALIGPFHKFQPRDTIEWFESRAVPLKKEADNRIFPVSDSSQSIIDCLISAAERVGVALWTQSGVDTIDKNDDGFQVTLANGYTHQIDKLILATGSSRKGYKLAESLGHQIVPPVPSLFTFTIDDGALNELSGLSVASAAVHLNGTGKKKAAITGPILITHWGLSGPAIIKCSAWHARDLHACNYHADLLINWLPEMNDVQVRDMISNYKTAHLQKQVHREAPFSEIPRRLWGYLLNRVTIGEAMIWERISKKQIQWIVDQLIRAPFVMTGRGVFKEEFVTAGGVSCDEVNFKTMESKICPGLHVVGELLNCDGVTGGFNFQQAWTTGALSIG